MFSWVDFREERMRRILWVSCLILITGSAAMALELVTNGAFEDEFAPAWQEDNVGQGASVARSVSFDGDADFEALAQKGTGNGHAKLDQVVVLPTLDVHFSVTAKMQASASTGGPWAAAGLALAYEDYFGHLLGTTYIVAKTTLCPWVDGDRVHVIEVPDEEWNGYAFVLDDELVNLAGVDPLSVHQLRISLVSQTGGDC